MLLPVFLLCRAFTLYLLPGAFFFNLPGKLLPACSLPTYYLSLSHAFFYICLSESRPPCVLTSVQAYACYLGPLARRREERTVLLVCRLSYVGFGQEDRRRMGQISWTWMEEFLACLHLPPTTLPLPHTLPLPAYHCMPALPGLPLLACTALAFTFPLL